MPKYRITSPDGRTFDVNAPDGATQEQVMAFAKTQFKAMPLEKAPDPTEGMSTFDKVAAGAGKAVVDTGRGLGQMLGLVSRADVEEARRLDAPLMKTGAGIAGNIAGNVGMALLPGGFLKGAGVVANAANATRAIAPALSAAGTALLAPRTIKGAVGLGTGMGLIQPSTSTEETVLNAGIGGVASAAVPVGVRAYQAGRAAAEPFYEAGRQRILGRAIQEASGGDAQALERIRAAAAPFVGPSMEGQPTRTIMGEIVPGSIPTVGQVAGNPSLAAMERTATQTDPIVSTQYGARMGQQNEARANELRRLAGTDGEREFMEAARQTTGNQLYGEAFRQGIDPAAARAHQRAIDALANNPHVRDALPIARRLAEADGIDITSADGSLAGMHYIKLALDDALNSGTLGRTKIGRTMERQIVQAQGNLVGLMQRLSPAYGTAMAEFQAASRPVNQMQAAQAIAESATNRLTGQVQPKAFANALTDRTTARATGFTGATLDNVFEPSQLNALAAMRDDLANASFAQSAGKNGSDTIQKLAYSNMLAQSGVPNWLKNLAPAQFIGNVAARGADAAYGRANRELSSRLAQSLLDPQTAAELLQANLGNQNALARISQGGATAGLLLPRVSGSQ